MRSIYIFRTVQGNGVDNKLNLGGNNESIICSIGYGLSVRRAAGGGRRPPDHWTARGRRL